MVVQGGYVSGRAQQLTVNKRSNALATGRDREKEKEREREREKDKDRSPTPAQKRDDSHAGTPASATPPPAITAAIVSITSRNTYQTVALHSRNMFKSNQIGLYKHL